MKYIKKYKHKFNESNYSTREEAWEAWKRGGYRGPSPGPTDTKKQEELDRQYYDLVPGDSNPRDLISNWLPIEEEESLNIKNAFTKKYETSTVLVNAFEKFGRRDKLIQFIEATRNELGGCKFRICKLPDEWYLVKLSDIDEKGSIFFKCDQIEGLKYFIKKTCLK